MIPRVPRVAALRQCYYPKLASRTTLYRQISSVGAISPAAGVQPGYSHVRLVPNLHANVKTRPSLATSPHGTPPVKPLYNVTRTPTRGLPVYEVAKAGGNLKLTRVRKLDGNREILKKELEAYLMPKPAYVKINPVTGHVIVKGWYKKQIDQFLIEQGF